MTTLAHLHSEYMRERQVLTIYLDQKLRQQLQLSKTNKKISVKKTGDEMTNLQHLVSIKIHVSSFDCDIDSGRVGPTVTGQNLITEPSQSFTLYQEQ